jgi:pyrroloquinoline quinone biosynthesis protein B
MIETVLLGNAQDGGVPQAGCGCARCLAAHTDPSSRQRVACLGIVDYAAGHCWMIDATPDFREQVHALQQAAPSADLAGILLTHAHMGHYTGLIHLGKEAWNTHQLPIFASAAMCGFLQAHAPWRQLVTDGNVALRPISPGKPFQLSARLTVTGCPVPHRNEWSDTLAFLVEGPARRLFYCPDVDDWDGWEQDLSQFLRDVDIALLDGTFYRASEAPNRDLAQIPHPLATDTADRVAGLACNSFLIHLNHTNPLWEPGPERTWLAARGVRVGRTGQRWRLDADPAAEQ